MRLIKLIKAQIALRELDKASKRYENIRKDCVMGRKPMSQYKPAIRAYLRVYDLTTKYQNQIKTYGSKNNIHPKG